MLTKTFDFTKVMCVQYWPASKDKDETYGDVHIGVVKEEELANFHIRTFRLYKMENGVRIDTMFIVRKTPFKKIINEGKTFTFIITIIIRIYQ